MRIIFITFFSLLFVSQASAQDQSNLAPASVEKSIYGIQTGFLGTWLYNESRLNNEFALRSQVGFDFRVEGIREFESFGPNSDFYGILHLSLEPRWYYNLDRRLKKGKNIDRNSGNFVALLTSLNLESVSFTNNDRIRSLDQIRFVPKWGIRRSLGKHISYEAGFGFGYAFFLNNTERTRFFPFRNERTSNFSVDIHLRIGFDL
jgi:hypothetical protein